MSDLMTNPAILAQLLDKDKLAAFQARFQMADDDAMRIETVWERALRTGFTPGKIRMEIPGSIVKGKTLNSGTRNFDNPLPQIHPKCQNMKWWKRTNHSTGIAITSKPCGQCDVCIEANIRDKQRRWNAGSRDIVHVLTWMGAASVDEARLWTGKFSDRVRKLDEKLPPRVSIVTEGGLIYFLFADTLTAGQQAAVTKYTGGSIDMLRSEDVKIRDYIGDLALHGESDHIACRFVGEWPKIAEPIDDYALGDGVKLEPDDPDIPADRKPIIPPQTAKERQRIRKALTPRVRQARLDDARTRNIGWWVDNWTATLGPYDKLAIEMSVEARINDRKAKISFGGGIKRLVRDYADALARRRPWEEGYYTIWNYLNPDAPA